MSSPSQPQQSDQRRRGSTSASVVSTAQSLRTGAERFMDSEPPRGMWAGMAEATSKAPTLGEIRRGSFGHGGWEEQGQLERRRSSGAGLDGRRPSAGRRSSSDFSGTSGGARRLPRRGSSGMGIGAEEAAASPNVLSNDGGFSTLVEEPTALTHDSTRSNGQSQPYQGATAQEMGLGKERASVRDMAAEEGDHRIERTETEKKRPRVSSKPQESFARDANGAYPNGYIPPPKKPWTEATLIGLAAFWKWFLTPSGFLITIYGANVVAWGGMLFLLLCGAAPAMCSQNSAANNYDGCNDINSPRRKWVEYDSQVLTALFCVTGLGLIPWRFRDLYWLLKFRLCNEKKKGHAAKMIGLRKLGGIHRGWLRLPGSDTIDEMSAAAYEAERMNSPDAASRNNSAIGETNVVVPKSSDGSGSGSGSGLDDTSPIKDRTGADVGLSALPENDVRLPLPISKSPENPMTGVRAPPTALWKLDFVVWSMIWNTIFQCCLCGIMWGLNRYDRPSWSTGLFVALGCIIAALGGIVMFKEGKKVKKVEGVPVATEQRLEAAEDDVEAGLGSQRENGNGIAMKANGKSRSNDLSD